MKPFNSNSWEIGQSCRARLVSVTPDAEKTIAYVARVSNPKNQENEKFEGLLKYCIKNNHVSVFEQAEMTVEVVIPLAIAAQLLRHKSFDFQQLSLRYSDQDELKELIGESESMYYLPSKARLQDDKNRQNSIIAGDSELDSKMRDVMGHAYKVADSCYRQLIEIGIAKEEARFVLPVGSYTRLYVKGNLRSWIHYLRVRDEEGVVQWEHVELARLLKKIFAEQFPVISKAISECDEKAKLLELESQIKELEEKLSKALIALEEKDSWVSKLTNRLKSAFKLKKFFNTDQK